MDPLLLSALCIFCFMCLMFFIALVKKDNSIVDVGWGIGFILVAYITFFFCGQGRLHQKLVTFIVQIWGLRLALYILIRNWGKPEDFRYAQWRKEWGQHVVVRSFFQVFMLQGLIMFINTLPIVIINSTPVIHKSLEWLYPVGSGIGFIGFFFEAVGDWQMYMFKNNPHKHGVMNTGLWRYSRHPNYFGEAVQWWAMFLLAIPSGRWYISILAPVTITFLLLRVSGVTLLEKKYDGNDDYSQYKRSTSSFIPWFPKTGS
jgi:steroid 5-alpha reductase family enzyme